MNFLKTITITTAAMAFMASTLGVIDMKQKVRQADKDCKESKKFFEDLSELRDKYLYGVDECRRAYGDDQDLWPADKQEAVEKAWQAFLAKSSEYSDVLGRRLSRGNA